MCRFVRLFLCEWLLRLTIHIFHSKVDAEFCSERQNASSSTCTLWVTVSMSAICRIISLYTLHCVVFSDWNVQPVCIGVYSYLFISFFPECETFFLHISSCVKSVTSLCAGVKPSMLWGDLLPRYVYNFSWFVWFRLFFYAVSHSAGVLVYLSNVCVCVCMSVGV